MIGTLFRVAVKPTKRQALIDFIDEDVRVARSVSPAPFGLICTKILRMRMPLRL
jgi:hypothetical protein